MTMRKDRDRLALAAEQKTKERDYWLKQLSGDPVKGCFPFDYIKNEANEPGIATTEAPVTQTVTARFAPPLLSRLREIGGDAEHTLHIILTAGLAALIYKTAGTPDMIIGTPIYKQAVEADFINTILPLRIRFHEDSTFKELLLQIRQTVSEAVAHQGYPLEYLARRLKISGSQQGAELFDMAILLENIHHKTYLQHLILPLVFSGQYSPTGLEISVDYDARVYRETTAQRLLSHYQEMLFQALTHIDKKLVQVEILAEEEKQRLLDMFNYIRVEYPRDKTIDELFREQARQHPHHTVLVGPVSNSETGEGPGNVSLTYDQLNRQSDRLACLLQEKGVRPDTMVGIMAERSIEVVIGMLAILKAGGAYLPLDPKYPASRIAYMLTDSGVTLLVAPAPLTLELETDTEIVHIDSCPSRDLSSTRPFDFSSAQPRDLAYIIYTSGTTGKPKGVLVEHENVIRLLFNDDFQFDFNEQDVWTLFHSFCFDFSVWEMYGALLYGARLVVATRIMARDPGEFLQVLAAHGVTVLNQTPSAFYQLMAESLKPGAPVGLNLRYVIFGGEALQPGKLAAWHEKYPAARLVNMFGITETTVHVTFREIGTQEIASGISDIGKPIPTLSLHVLDPHRLLLPVGIPGELCVGGKGVARGYLNRPELTAEKFVASPFDPGERLYCSGDLARIMESGDLEYLGRMDHQVQVRGYRIELGEIESQLLTHEHIREAVAVAGTAPDNSYFLCAYVVPKAADALMSLDPAALQDYLSRRLPDYMIPHYFVRMESIPLTANGKVDRSRLPDPQVLPEGQYVAPRTHEELVMAYVWEEMLAVEQVGIDHNFFNLGGDSIKAIRLISAINARLNSHLKILDLYTHGTIRQLVTLLDRPESFNRLALKQNVTTAVRELKEGILAEKPGLGDIVEDIFPMSDIEKGIVFYYLKHLGTGIYHDQFVYPLRYANFDRQRFETALSLLIKKHAILRTGYNTEDFEEPVHLVYRHISLPVLYDDLSGLSAAGKKAFIEDLLARDRQKGFDYNVAPLWRMVFLSMGHDNYYLLFIFHHAILDGWSAAFMMTELQNTYLELKTNPAYALPPLTLSYKDAVIEEMVQKQNPRTLAYWKRELQGYQRLEFSETVKSKAELEPMKFYRTLEGSGWVKQINRIAAQYQTSFKNLCFGAYVFIMSLFSYEDDLVVGCVTNNRPGLQDGDKILGCFLNTVPVRMKIPRGITWEQYIRLVEQKMMTVKQHEGLSLFEIALAVGEKGKDRNPFFDTIFNFTDFHVFREADPQARDIPGDEGSAGSGSGRPQQEPLSITDFQDTNTLFDFEVDITSGHLMLRPKYNGSAIGEEMVKRCCRYFLAILEKYHKDPQGLVRRDEMLSGAEKEDLLYRFNDTAAPYEQHKTMHLLFEEQVARTPEQVALIDNDGVSHLSYLELNRRANRLAHELLTPGVKPHPGPGELAAVVMDRCIQMVTAVMGILKAGMAYVPLEPYLPDLRIRKLLLALEVTSVLVTPSTYEKMVNIGNDLPCLRHIFCLDSTGSAYSPQGDPHLEEHSWENPAPLARAGDISYIIFTSGSTGIPKGVVETHRPVINVIRWVNQTFAVGQADKLLFIASLGFDLSVYDIFGILAAGGVLRVVAAGDIKDPRQLLDIIMREGITFWDSAPAALQQLVPFFHEVAEADRISRLRLVFLSGDWIPVTLPDALRQTFAGVRVISLGGATEATVWSNFYPIGNIDPAWPSIPYGKPIRNAGYYILDRHLDLCPIGVAGDLYIGGQCLASGYINDVELTAGKFISQPFTARPGAGKNQKPIIYKTGDMARWFTDGNMQFLGRKDLQVKIRGYRVELGEIEAQLVAHPLISDGVVVDRVDAGGSKYLCAYFILKPRAQDRGIDKEELKTHLAKELPDYMIPAYFIPIDTIPTTANGKLDRKGLPDPASVMAERIYAPPENHIQEKLVEIWSEVLFGKNAAARRIGIDDDFFDLGGHSLNATMTVSKIHRDLNVKIPLAEIFNSPTIRELAPRIKAAGQDIYDAVRPVEKREYYALSSAQLRMYFLQQMELKSTGYNIQEVVLLPAEMDLDRLQLTFSRLIQRHESLRTSFHMLAGQAAQRIHDQVDFFIEDCQQRPQPGDGDDSPAQGLEEDLIRSFIRPFTLSAAPLLRVGLFRLDETQRLMAVDMHHIVSDGVSHAILIQDFMALYEDEDRAMPALRIHYKDYSQWQLSDLRLQAMKKQETHWLENFSGEIPVLNLPADYTRPAIQSYDGSTCDFELGSQETKALNQLALAEKTTLFMVLTAIFNVLLARICNQEDIVIGTPIAGRRHTDIERVIGMFVNTLVLRNYPHPGKPFTHFLSEVKENTLKAFENQDYQFEDLVEKVGAHRDVSRNPLFDVMFVLQNMQVRPEIMVKATPEKTGAGEAMLNVQSFRFDPGVSRFDLTLNARETRSGIHFSLEYATRLFKEATMRRISGYFHKIVLSVLEFPGKKIGDIDLMAAEEKQQLLNEFNNTAALYPEDTPIHELFAQQAQQTPHRIALVTAPRSGSMFITYRALQQKTDALAGCLQEKGVQADTIVGIMLERSVAMIIGIFAILKAGGAYLPIEPEYPPDRINYMLEDGKVRFLVKNSNSFSNFSAGEAVETISIDDHAVFSSSYPLNGSMSRPGNLAYIIYTSGSSGKPKGVMINHASVNNILFALQEKYPLYETDNYLFKTSYIFDVSVAELFGWFFFAGRLTLLEPGAEKDPQQMVETMIKQGVTHINFVPSMFGLFLEVLNEQVLDRLSSAGLRYIFLAGEALAPLVVRRFNHLHPAGKIRLENIYGPTEGTVYAAQYPLAVWDNGDKVPIGKPVANVRLYILGKAPHYRLKPLGVPGELCIGGKGVARGYLNNPGLTLERIINYKQPNKKFLRGFGGRFFQKEPPGRRRQKIYKTGDLARWLPGGNIEFLGRMDNQVKIRGFRVELGEIEHHLLNHPEIKEAVVLINAGLEQEKYLCAYIVPTNSRVNPAELRDYLSARLPYYMVPGHFVSLEYVPLTPSGKIDRQMLLTHKAAVAGSGVAYMAPATSLENLIAETWKQVLGLEKVGVNHRFFDVGGNSANILQVHHKLTETLSMNIPVMAMFLNPTVNSLANYLEGKGLNRGERGELGDSQHQQHQQHQQQLEPDQLEKDKNMMKQSFQKLGAHPDL